MAEGLSDRLRGIMGKISSMVALSDSEVEEIIKELQRALLQADVDVDIVFELSEAIRQKSKKKPEAGVSKREYVTKLIYDELVSILGEGSGAKKGPDLLLEPHRLMLLGLFGSGKTTTTGKLAYFYKSRGLKVVVVGCDFSRPAAYEQLAQVAERVNVPIINGKKPEVAKKELEKYKDHVVIIDSAGRDALDGEMIDEIKKLDKVFAPQEKFLVIPAELGQESKRQAEEFKKNLKVTGVIVTRMDSTAKGGATLAACKVVGAKVKFLAVGEKPTDIETYVPERFVSRLLGFGDLQTLLEKFKGQEAQAEKLEKGEVDLNLFYDQINAMQKQGSIKKLMDMIPGMGGMKLPGEVFDVGEVKMKKWKYAIESMTPKERENPEIIKSSRVERISKGSGVSVQDINELLSNFRKMKKMMKQLTPGKMKSFRGMGDLGKLFGR
ncbi:MAG: signal recognition particle protein [Candidatus Aenigmarchaeota archaeon]|nr:signal recognition particle protein [Candidatus Aenigmarchaeota archaeon]